MHQGTGAEFSSNQREPSGPSSTSRSRLPMFQRSTGFAPPCPSKVMRSRVMLTSPVMNPLGFPLWESLSAAVEHQVAGREHRRPVDDGLGEVGPCVRACDGHAVVVHRIGDERPTVVLARLDQVEFVAAARPMLEFPEATVRREREAVRRADVPWSMSRTVSGWVRRTLCAHDGRGLGGLRVLGGSITGTDCAPFLPYFGLPGAGFRLG